MPPRARRNPPEAIPGQPTQPNRLLFERVEVNWEVLDALCGVRATVAEIASHFNCSEDTIERRVMEEKGVTWSEYYRARAGSGAIALRRKQFQVALAGNVTMLIWLGKQLLGQVDKSQLQQQLEVTGAGGGAMEVNTNDVRERIANRISGIADRMTPGAAAAVATLATPGAEPAISGSVNAGDPPT